MADRVAPERLVGERVGGRFVIERPIGHGPLSSAFRARDERLHRRVTVKLFHPQHADDVTVVNAQLELAKGVARLSHPNIATVIDRGEHEGMPFVVLEYVRGENMQERIERFAPLRIVEVVEFGQAIARALAYAHAQGVVHGNLRPGNVLVSEDREVKLVDFGGGSYVANLTGGASYVAPERRGADITVEPDPCDDVYALGVLLFVALTEHEPEPGIDASRVQLLRPDVSPRLAAIVARAMAYDPRDRYESMHEVASELATVRIPGFRDVRAGSAADLVNQSTGVIPAAELPDAAGYHRDQERERPRRHGHDHQQEYGHDDDGGAPRRERPRRGRRAKRARLFAWSMVLIPVAVVGLVVAMVAGERGNEGDPGPAKPRPVNEQPVQVQIAGQSSFDPDGDDNSEREDLIQNVSDGNVESAWQTEGYESQTFVVKPGVGFWVRLPEAADVREARIYTDLPGWTARIYAADQPVLTLAGWKPVSKPFPVESGAPIEIDVGDHPYTTYLVWITRLSIDTKDTNRFRARVGELRLFARPPV